MPRPKDKTECLLTRCVDCCYYNDGVFTVCPDWHEPQNPKMTTESFYKAYNRMPHVIERKRMNKMNTVEDIDETITEASEMVNKHYEELLHELFTLGDYMFDLRIEYKDVDGKTISMSWQDRDKRVMYLQGE